MCVCACMCLLTPIHITLNNIISWYYIIPFLNVHVYLCVWVTHYRHRMCDFSIFVLYLYMYLYLCVCNCDLLIYLLIYCFLQIFLMWKGCWLYHQQHQEVSAIELQPWVRHYYFISLFIRYFIYSFLLYLWFYSCLC